MIYFIAYDIADTKRLHKAARILENFGMRVQYSFFECEMTEEQKDTVVSELLHVINTKKDRLVVYPVCEDCLQSVKMIGNGSFFKPENFMIL